MGECYGCVYAGSSLKVEREKRRSIDGEYVSWVTNELVMMYIYASCERLFARKHT